MRSSRSCVKCNLDKLFSISVHYQVERFAEIISTQAVHLQWDCLYLNITCLSEARDVSLCWAWERNFCLKHDVMTGCTVLQRCGSHHWESYHMSVSLAVDDYLINFLPYGKRKMFISYFVLHFFNYKRQQKYHFSLTLQYLSWSLSFPNADYISLGNILSERHERKKNCTSSLSLELTLNYA